MYQTELEKQIIKTINYMKRKHCFITTLEIAEGGEIVLHLKKGQDFKPKAYKTLDNYITKVCRQRTEIKFDDFHHVIWFLDNIVINFWGCE